MEIEIHNLDKALKKIDSMKDLKLRPAMVKVTRRIQRDAMGLVPVDKGRLIRSISTQVREGDDEVSGKVFTNVEYSRWVEEGTSFMKPQPYMLPALNMNKEYANNMFKELIVDNITEAIK